MEEACTLCLPHVELDGDFPGHAGYYRLGVGHDLAVLVRKAYSLHIELDDVEHKVGHISVTAHLVSGCREPQSRKQPPDSMRLGFAFSGSLRL